MYKLIIMIEAPEDSLLFDEAWPSFLRQAEKMPGLIREAAVRVSDTVFGNLDIYMLHELFFKTREEVQAAMDSPQGQVAGQVLQKITGGRMVLLVAEHREDDMENIRKYQFEEPDADTK
jgi:uncharacterized protein (TIGR02118 family)